MSCGVGCRCSSDLAAAAPIWFQPGNVHVPICCRCSPKKPCLIQAYHEIKEIKADDSTGLRKRKMVQYRRLFLRHGHQRLEGRDEWDLVMDPPTQWHLGLVSMATSFFRWGLVLKKETGSFGAGLSLVVVRNFPYHPPVSAPHLKCEIPDVLREDVIYCSVVLWMKQLWRLFPRCSHVSQDSVSAVWVLWWPNQVLQTWVPVFPSGNYTDPPRARMDFGDPGFGLKLQFSNILDV